MRAAYTGLLVATAAVGGIAGGALSGWLSKRVGSARIIWFSVLVLGLPSFCIALARPGWWVALYPVGFTFFAFSGVVYNVAQVSYRQATCPPALMSRMNAAVRWVGWGVLPLGGVLGGTLGTVVGVRPTIWIGLAGTWAAGWWVYLSPLRRMRDINA